MRRSSPLLILLAVALAAGVGWIATDTGPVGGTDAENLEREEGVARAAPPEADLIGLPARSEGEAPPESEGGVQPTPLDSAERTTPRRTSAADEQHSLRFRLEDDRGEPIVHATFTRTMRGANEVGTESASSTGDYVLKGLMPGEYLVAVDTFVLDPVQEPAWYVVPGDGEPILLTFTRRASVTGRVVDDAGVPVQDLDVNLVRTSADGEEEERRRAGESSEEGGFSFPLVRPGPVSLTTSNGFVSAELELVLGIGESLEGVELRLEGGGTVQGRVLDAESKPVVGVDVIIVDAVDFRTKTETDEEGAFRLGPILPGTYQVTTILKEEANANVFDQIVSQSVTIARGDVIDILLQPKQETPVLLSGHVLYAGEKLGDCAVYGFREDESLLDAVRMARSNDEGEYEMKLGGPGPYVFLFEPRVHRSNSPTAPLRMEIPDATAVRRDLTVPASSIGGRVLDADGEPVRGVKVIAIPADDYMDFQLPDSRRGTTSSKDGDFLIPYLAAGEYVIRAGSTGSESPLAWEPLEGVQVNENTPTQGLELRALVGATVTGTVRGPDGPIQGAAVYVRASSGRLQFLRGAATDAAGAFRISSVPAGEITVTARATGLASAESERKTATAGEETTFELRLVPGSLLTATAVDGNGAGVPCSIHVLDASGRDVTRLTSLERSVGNFTDALSTTIKTVGPLIAGEYEVVAATRDGRRASRRVEVDGKKPVEVEVRF